MSEEVLKEGEQIETPEGGEQQQAQEPSPIEQQAMSMGWRPREEFDGSDDEFIDAKEFVRRKPLFDRLEQQSKQLKQVSRTLEDFKKHYSTMREVEYKRAIEALKLQQRAAVEDSDTARYDLLDKQIDSFEQEFEKIKDFHETTQASPPDPAELTNWMSKNPWYQKDDAMTAYADRVGIKFQANVQRGDMSPAEVLKEVEKAVKAEFPHKFKNPNKGDAPNVGEGKSNTQRSGGTKFELNDLELKIMNNLVRSGTMTKEQYISDLKKAKGIV